MFITKMLGAGFEEGSYYAFALLNMPYGRDVLFVLCWVVPVAILFWAAGRTVDGAAAKIGKDLRGK